MKYMMYRLKFPAGVHLGEKNLNESNYTFYADTLFSALYIESLKKDESYADSLLQDAMNGHFLLSDAFPYINDTEYLPKPIKRIEAGEKEGDSDAKKAYKNLKYVPMRQMDEYLQGRLDVMKERDKLKKLGHSVVKASVAVTGKEETEPYHVGVYYFSEMAGLYFIAGFTDLTAEAAFTDLLNALSFTGIGGKRASGIGRFRVAEQRELKADYFENPKNENGYMTLSVALPKENELEETLTSSQGYQLQERGGFVASESYAPEQRKKNSLYVFSAGSCFRKRFTGDIYHVENGGAHPIYRYAKPLFWTM